MSNEPRAEELVPELYRELHRLAERAMRGERADHTLQPTALVHEAYVRLVRSPGEPTADHRAFLALAARVMRQVLVDHARTRRRGKRGGGALRVTLGGLETPDPATPFDLLALDEALDRLARVSEQQVRIVELRYLGGLSVEESAAVLGVSPTTIKRDAAMARAFPYNELLGGELGAARD
jgi:RNA polymerase sigma factor (TIGR02999 family)